MQYFAVILLAAGAIFCLFGAAIVKTATTQGALGNRGDNYVTEYISKVEHDLKLTGAGMTLDQYLALQFIMPVALGALSAELFGSVPGTVMLMALGAMLPKLIVELKRNTAKRNFETRYVRALSQMASALHSGRSVGQAVDAVAACDLLDEKMRNDFRGLSAKIKLGTPIAQVFEEYAEDSDSNDAEDVATAISIMMEVGGDPGKAVEKLENDIERRLLYRRKRESMMVEGKLISLMSDIVPFIILGGTFIVMPGTIQSYFTSPLLTAVFVGVIVVMAIGSVITHKMLDDKADIS